MRVKTALAEAVELILSGDRQLAIILVTTLRMALASSVAALLIGAPLGVLLGGYAGRGKRALVTVNRTLTFGLGALARQKAPSLSGGETARLALARLLMEDYPLLILDEPTAAMDIAATLLAEDCLRRYRERTGCTVLLVTHSLSQAKRLADRVLFLSEGRLAEQGPAAQVLETPREPQTRAFLDFYALG